MNPVKKFKDLIVSGFLSLSKAEQEILKEVVNGINNDVSHEQQVQKQEIKIIGKKRFYEILDRADNYLSSRDKEKLAMMMEQRGLLGVDVTFTNKIHEDLFGNKEYKLKTDNGLYQFANTIQVKSISGDQKEIRFFVNIVEHAVILNHYDKLAGLKYFEIVENRAKYAYNISNFIGAEKINNFEMVLTYAGDVVLNGVKEDYEDEGDKVMTKSDLMSNKRKTHTLMGGEFLLD